MHTHVLINLDDAILVAVSTDQEEHDWDNDSVVDFYMNLDPNPAQD